MGVLGGWVGGPPTCRRKSHWPMRWDSCTINHHGEAAQGVVSPPPLQVLREGARRQAVDGQCLTSSNTSMKVFPMIFLLVSGSVTPASLPRKRSLASTRCRLMPILCVGVDTMRPHVIAESDTSGLGERGERARRFG